ncbi:MAG: histidine phosphatase family protein [Candidatus Korarchaeota archaeon]|nr:histidine phosphatase family protein [Candidatus Korarchaeota archaeon]NIU81937.1 histidine phosphatase family protein [Candidatus Thorarchaeota archaeon]NIW12395.1 histidine phosphatase family protein [Candidatus Thorarchaeota archaeon]NIW51187.1 histidine phosphatase family protein [Candidatus Korarchaeota archaeon]
MSELYITRHGQTEWNAERRLQGWQGSPLTDLGVQQAKWLKKRLQHVNFEAVYYSPLNRTQKTAEILMQGREIPLIKEPGLKEINMGTLEGKTFEEVEAMYPTVFSTFWKAPHKYIPVTGESFFDVRRRVICAVESILSKHPSGKVLLVSHGCATKILLSHFEGRPLRKLWDPPRIQATSLSIVEVKDGKGTIILYGDTSHYQPS